MHFIEIKFSQSELLPISNVFYFSQIQFVKESVLITINKTLLIQVNQTNKLN